MNTTTRNIIIAAVIAVLVISAVIAVILLTKSNDADKINKELANMSNPTASQQEENDGDVTTGEYDHSTEPIVIESEPEEDSLDEDIPEENVEVIAPDEPDDYTPVQTTKPVSTTTTAATSRPAVTVVTTTPAVTAPPSTVRTDLPVVTAEPTTAATTATEPDIAVEYDDNGFPADPEPSETFKDDDGQWWIYNPIFGWGEWDGDGSTTMYEFPDNYDEIGSGEQILW